MIRKLFFIAASILVITSCVNEVDNANSLQLQAGEDDEVFYATLEGSPDAGTKVYADSKMRTLWNADDRVSIFRKTTGNEQYRFTGEDGANAGNFSHVSGSKSQTALNYFYSLYPYSEATSLSADGVVSLTMPAEQVYKENSFGIGANTMLSVTSNNQLMFRNVGSFLSFKFYGDGVSVKSIKLQGNNNEKLAGAGKVTMALNGTPAIEMQDNATRTITLTCTEPVAIGADKDNATVFWFVLPPTDFTKGITVTVTDAQGGIFVMNSAAHLTFERNKLTSLSAKKVVPVPAVEHEAVDLGLSVKWATCNVGADSPEEYGEYFAWGETEPKEKYDWSTYKWCNGSYNTLTRYNNSSEFGTVDNRTTLLLEDDAARANWGGNWRMPTFEELTELRYYCDWTQTTQNGVYGYLVKSRTNTNSIFLPAAGGRGYDDLYTAGSWGYYWSSSLRTDYPYYAYLVGFHSGGVSRLGFNRYYGLPVRPVTE